MRFKPLKTLGLILSQSKDKATSSGFFSIPLARAHSAIFELSNAL